MLELAVAPPAFTQRDEARMRRAADKERDAQQALQTLKDMRTRPNEDLKAKAREKVAALKQRLQQLRMLGASPRQIAQIARELASAAKDYASAGGRPEAAQTAQPTYDTLSAEDRAFVADARKLAKELKEAAADAARRAWLTGDSTEAEEATKAAKAAEDGLDDAEQAMRRAGSVLDLTA